MTITLRAGVLNSGIQQNGTEFLTVDTSNNATLSNNLVVTGITTLSNNLTVTGVTTLGAGAVLGTPASGNLANCTGYVQSVGALTSGTAVASTSGTSIDFTSIPSWVKRITVMLSGVSTNGSSAKLIQIGAGSITSTGYIASSTQFSANATLGSTAGFPIYGNSTADTHCGSLVLTTLGSNVWVASGNTAVFAGQMTITGGGVTLGGTLDRVRFTTTNGTDTFDAGSVNILYE